MQNIRKLGKCEHHHLERHDHGEHAQKINQLRSCCLNTGDVPGTHGAADNNQYYGYKRNEKGIAEAADEICFLQCVRVIQPADKGLGKSVSPLFKAG